MRILKPAAALVLLLFLASCAGSPVSDRLSIIEGISVFNQAGALTAKATEAAGRQGLIGWQEACKVEQWSRLAKRISDEALIAAVRDDLDRAEALFSAARNAFNGVSEEATVLVADHCAGN